MLSTLELERYIKKEVLKRLNEVDWEKINFKVGNENSVEGTYIFTQDYEYHMIFMEKGKIRENITTSEKEEVLWYAVNIFSFDLAMEYALNNNLKGKDFRRFLFKKEIEVCSLFGKAFEKRKRYEIEEILKKNPYNDI